MITRAQAEALLPLAESLEACERLGVEVYYDEGQEIYVNEHPLIILRADDLTGAKIRTALASLMPK